MVQKSSLKRSQNWNLKIKLFKTIRGIFDASINGERNWFSNYWNPMLQTKKALLLYMIGWPMTVALFFVYTIDVLEVMGSNLRTDCLVTRDVKIYTWCAIFGVKSRINAKISRILLSWRDRISRQKLINQSVGCLILFISFFWPQHFTKKNICIFSGRGYFQNWFGIMPRKKEINVVVGKIN